MNPDVKINNYRESQGDCQLCGKTEELRPYGPNDEWICFDCGQLDHETTKKKFEATLNKTGITIIDARLT
jgi:hypothetical protein